MRTGLEILRTFSAGEKPAPAYLYLHVTPGDDNDYYLGMILHQNRVLSMCCRTAWFLRQVSCDISFPNSEAAGNGRGFKSRKRSADGQMGTLFQTPYSIVTSQQHEAIMKEVIGAIHADTSGSECFEASNCSNCALGQQR